MLLLRLLSTALCAAVAALVFALVYSTGGVAPRPAGRAVGGPTPCLASLDATRGVAPRPAGRAVGGPTPCLASLDAVPPARVCPSPARAPRVRLFAEPATAPSGGGRRAIAARAERSPGGVPINVIDVAPGVPAAQITGLIQLGPGEHVIAVNDRVPASDLEVGALIASLPRRGEYLDLSVASPTRERRVLVLLH